MAESPAGQALVLGDHVTPALPELLDETRRALDIRKEEGDRPGRQLGHAESVTATPGRASGGGFRPVVPQAGLDEGFESSRARGISPVSAESALYIARVARRLLRTPKGALKLPQTVSLTVAALPELTRIFYRFSTHLS